MDDVVLSVAPLGGDDLADSLAAFLQAWTAAWNTHDIEAATRLVATDVNFVTVAGIWLKGAEEFAAHHRKIHRHQMRHSRWTTLAHEIRHLQGNLYLINLEWMIVGDLNPDGSPRDRARLGVFTWVAARRDGSEPWVIVAAHNTNLRGDVRHRLLHSKSQQSNARAES